jgi:hypothetical protein
MILMAIALLYLLSPSNMKFFKWIFSLFDKKKTEIIEEKWVWPLKNCFCHMHPFVWCPVHDGNEKPER